MMTTALDHYHARMQRVLDHIDRHLDGDHVVLLSACGFSGKGEQLRHRERLLF